MSNAALLQHPELAAPTQDRVIPCLGVGCKQHGNCLCYQEVEFSDPSRMRLYFCPKRADGSRTRYVPIRSQA